MALTGPPKTSAHERARLYLCMPPINDRTVNALFPIINRKYGVKIKSALKIRDGTNTYKITTEETVYFLKVRASGFNESSLLVPCVMEENKNISNIIKPVKALSGRLFIKHNSLYISLYPYVDGKNCWNYNLSNEQWIQFGSALFNIHNTELPDAVIKKIPKEQYSSRSRKKVTKLLKNVERIKIKDYRHFLVTRGEILKRIIDRAEDLSKQAKNIHAMNCVCHGDIHAGNLLIDKNNDVLIIDWESIIFAPKERDLMFIGGGICKKWQTPSEVQMFYDGYKDIDINSTLLAYYRYERIIEDVEDFNNQMNDKNIDIKEKLNIVNILESMFDKNDVVDAAFKTAGWL
jgi:spectinomycin phosphotransferase